MGKKTDTLATTGKKAEASAVSWQGAKAVKGASSSAGSPSSPTTVISASAPANPALLKAFLKQQEADFRAMAPPELSEALSSCQSELEAAWLVKTHLYNLDPIAVPLFMRLGGVVELEVLQQKPSLAELMPLVDTPGRSHAKVVKLMEKASTIAESSVAALVKDHKRLVEFEKMLTNRDDFKSGRLMR